VGVKGSIDNRSGEDNKGKGGVGVRGFDEGGGNRGNGDEFKNKDLRCMNKDI